MNTKLLMTASAATLGLAGAILTFMPEEVLQLLNTESSRPLQIIMQILGALYLSFGVLNWMSKSNLIGGIYSRPLALANFAHYFIAGMALVKGVIAEPALPNIFWVFMVTYSIFAILFGVVLFRHPIAETDQAMRLM